MNNQLKITIRHLNSKCQTRAIIAKARLERKKEVNLTQMQDNKSTKITRSMETSRVVICPWRRDKVDEEVTMAAEETTEEIIITSNTTEVERQASTRTISTNSHISRHQLEV